MRNSSFDTLRVKTVCENKLHINFRSGAEANGWVMINGKKTARITVPHGRKPLPIPTYKSMAQQLKVTIEQFDSLLECNLTYEDYLKILQSQKIID